MTCSMRVQSVPILNCQISGASRELTTKKRSLEIYSFLLHFEKNRKN